MTPTPRPIFLDWLLALVLGGVATLGFAPYHYVLAPIVAFAGLWLLASHCGPLRAAVLGWLFGFSHFAAGIYWVFISTTVFGGAAPWLGLTLCTVLFSFLALYPALVTGLGSAFRVWRSSVGYAVVPVLWMLGELLRGWVYSGFPWLSLGYIAIDTPAERLAPLAGVHALSAIFIVSSFALYRAMADDRMPMRIVSMALTAFPCLGLLLPMPETWTKEAAPPMPVAIVQGNFSQDVKWLPGMSQAMLQRYHEMTKTALDAKLIAWPESVPNEPYDMVMPYYETLDSELQKTGATVLSGVLIRDSDTVIYNSMIAVGASHGRYDKHHLVPFGEYFPIPAWLRPIMDVLGTPYSDFSVGDNKRDPIVVDGQQIGVTICFEDVFAAEYARESRKAALLVNSTNDAWFATSSAPYQHLDIARLRALENGRWLIRATNTGVSGFIDPNGRIVSQTQLFETAVLRGTPVPRKGITPYARNGDAPLWYLAAVMLVFCGITRRWRT